ERALLRSRRTTLGEDGSGDDGRRPRGPRPVPGPYLGRVRLLGARSTEGQGVDDQVLAQTSPRRARTRGDPGAPETRLRCADRALAAGTAPALARRGLAS